MEVCTGGSFAKRPVRRPVGPLQSFGRFALLLTSAAAIARIQARVEMLEADVLAAMRALGPFGNPRCYRRPRGTLEQQAAHITV